MAPGPSIPSWYNGILFRSSTEARYAVLFDQLGVPWQWEPEGFNADGTWYRPDFLAFPALGMLWVEVKGSWEQDPRGVDRWRSFSLWRHMPSRSALLEGVPSIGGRIVVLGGDPETEDPLKGPWEDHDLEWRPCPSGRHFDLAVPGRFRTKFAEDGCGYSDQEGRGDTKLERAIQTAQGYRFSHRPQPAGTAA